MERRGKHDNGRVASPKSVPIYRKVYGCISKTLHSHLDVFVYSNSGGGGGGGGGGGVNTLKESRFLI